MVFGRTPVDHSSRIVRPVRVTIPANPGFFKALRIAASLQLPVRLLPGQPGAEVLDELTQAAHFYLHDAMVDAPVEFFHSVFAAFRGMRDVRTYSALGTMLAKDPYCEVYKAVFSRAETHSRTLLRRRFITGEKKLPVPSGPARLTTMATP
jgi:hypothetical protein